METSLENLKKLLNENNIKIKDMQYMIKLLEDNNLKKIWKKFGNITVIIEEDKNSYFILILKKYKEGVKTLFVGEIKKDN